MNTLLSRLRARPVAASIGVIALVLALGVGITGVMLGGGSGSQPAEVVNRAGGYRVVPPDDWNVTRDGAVTKLSSPSKDAVVSVSTGNPGKLHDAGALFFQQVGRNYRNTKLTGVEGQQIGPRRALVYGGLGINDKNVKITFLAITIEAKPTNYAISVFTAAGSDPQQVLPRVHSVVQTFRTLERS